MATTTNYGWTTPDDTALVKDGAAAIRTLGSSVDTTTKALNPSTTLGDIEYRSSTANTNTRLGIGTTGQILAVSGGVPAWTTPAASASGLTLISSTTIGTTVSSISLANNTFTSTYNNYRVIFDCSQTTAFSSSGAITINFRYRDNGTDMTGAAYNYTGYQSSSGTVAGINQAGVTSNKLGIALDATPNRFAAVIDLFGIFTTAQTMHTVNFTGMDGGTNMSGKLDGFEFNPTAYDSMTFFLSTGTMTGGRIRVYGYQNS
jgi:hypothetical protein